MRIELTWPAWKAGALPLSYARLKEPIFYPLNFLMKVERVVFGSFGLKRDSESPVGVVRIEETGGHGCTGNS